jgi:hypothetical protein
MYLPTFTFRIRRNPHRWQPRFIYYFEGGTLKFTDAANNDETFTFTVLKNE